MFSELKGVLEPYNFLSKRKPTVLKPPDSVRGLASAFPVLSLIEVSLGAVEEQNLDSKFLPQLKLDCDFLKQDNLPTFAASLASTRTSLFSCGLCHLPAMSCTRRLHCGDDHDLISTTCNERCTKAN